jgi:hypothetical protein
MSQSLLESTSSDLSDLPDVPAQVISKDLQRVDTRGRIWRIHPHPDGHQAFALDWTRLRRPADGVTVPERTVRIAMLALADRLTRKKGWTISNDFHSIRRLAKWQARRAAGQQESAFLWAGLDEGILRAFLAYGMTTKERGNDFARIRTIYEWGVARAYPDFSLSLLRALKDISAPGNFKGQHVRTRDHTKGPLSNDERNILLRALAEGKGRAKDRAVVMIHLELGINPNQAARLKNAHFIRYDAPIRGAVFTLYQLLVPRNKKRTVHVETKARPISLQLGQLLESLQLGSAKDALLHWIAGANNIHAIGTSMKRFAHTANLVSPRTGERLNLQPRRFRYSLATEAAEQGASDHHIAEILDHTDTQHVGVYRKTSSTIADRMEAFLDPSLKPLAERFRGTIIDSVVDQPFPGVQPNVIPGVAPHLPAFPLDIGGIGMCGLDVSRYGLCKLFPPLACYQCPKFAAFRSGPHKKVLESIDKSIQAMETSADLRIPKELQEVCAAISQLLFQIEPAAPKDGREDSPRTA